MFETLRSWCSKRPSTAQEIAGHVDKISSLLSKLKEKAECVKTGLSERLKPIQDKYDDTKKKVPFKDGNVDADAWQGKPEPERKEIGETLRCLFKELTCLNAEELCVGKFYFFIFFFLLLIASVVYVKLHKPSPPTVVKPALISGVAKQVRDIELDIAALKKAKNEAGNKKTPDLEKKIDGLKKQVEGRIKELRAKVDGLDLSFESLRLLGVAESEGERGEITETDSLENLKKVLLPELESLREVFLWNDRRGRWYEIAWWAEIGVLVGILFYIAGCLGRGSFSRQEIAMFWTEALIAPVVVLIIFFLFVLTGITGISPATTSIQGNVGFAFIFGFAIRRTLGLLDIIKKRIFPDPSPTSDAAK